jgi:hypothetical protein
LGGTIQFADDARVVADAKRLAVDAISIDEKLRDGYLQQLRTGKDTQGIESTGTTQWLLW